MITKNMVKGNFSDDRYPRKPTVEKPFSSSKGFFVSWEYVN